MLTAKTRSLLILNLFLGVLWVWGPRGGAVFG